MATGAPGPEWLRALGRNRREAAYALFVLALLLAILPLWLAFRWEGEYRGVGWVAALLPLTSLGLGLWRILTPRDKFTDAEAGRALVLAGGGLFGLCVFLVSIALGIKWWETLTGGLEKWQGSEGWRIWVFLLVQLGGLAIMFISLQLGRTEERANPFLRRLVYSYNAVLTGLLLLEILGFVNVLAAAYFQPSYDWTTASIYSLSSRSENILEGLKKPMHVYVVLPRNDRLDTFRRTQALLDNFRSVNDKIQAEYLSPDLDRERVSQLAERYHFTDREGVLLVYGTEPNTESQFVKADTLFTGSQNMMMQRRNEPQFFKGESELVNAVNFLAEGKQKPTVYFTQGNGELDITDLSGRELNQGAGLLKQRLEQDNIAVKGLQFAAVEGQKSKKPDIVMATSVPKDASLVVVAGPQQRLPDFALKALREYMNPTGPDADKRKGKMIVLQDVVLTPKRDAMVKTGMEEFVSEYGVQIGDNRVLQVSGIVPIPLYVIALVNRDIASRNPVAAAFSGRGGQFVLHDVRTVQASTQPRPEARYQADPLLLVPARLAIWAETDLRGDPTQQARAVVKLSPQAIEAKLSQDDLPVAVAVTEQAAAPDPHVPPGEGTPRLVVFGDSGLASNWAQDENPNGRYYDLFFSIVSWLRERPSSVGIEAKKQDIYQVDAAGVNFWRMVGVPAALMFVGIVGLGTGVWVVRRR